MKEYHGLSRDQSSKVSNLLDKIQELKEKVEKEETLVIVFYGGHGGMVPSKENKPSFEWHALGSDQLAQL